MPEKQEDDRPLEESWDEVLEGCTVVVLVVVAGWWSLV